MYKNRTHLKVYQKIVLSGASNEKLLQHYISMASSNYFYIYVHITRTLTSSIYISRVFQKLAGALWYLCNTRKRNTKKIMISSFIKKRNYKHKEKNTKMSNRFLDCKYRSTATWVGSSGGTCLVLSWASTTVSLSSL